MYDSIMFEIIRRRFLLLITLFAITISACQVKAVERVLILGNSITAHGPAPAIGWKGNWGMAASKQENDFVHLLEAKFKAKNNDVQVKYANIASSFEQKYWDFDKAVLSKLIDGFSPDLIIVRLGENVPGNMLSTHSLEQGLKSLVGYVSQGKPVRVCITTTFWGNKAVSDIIKKTGADAHWKVINLSGLSSKKGATAAALFTNQSVGMHPSDKGMRLIADEIWKAVAWY